MSPRSKFAGFYSGCYKQASADDGQCHKLIQFRCKRGTTMPKMGLVLQGGGALGAYEYGAVTRLVELGWEPVVVTGVSIGAATAAAIAGAREGDICASLKRLWEAITLSPLPFGRRTDRQRSRYSAIRVFGNLATIYTTTQNGRACVMYRPCAKHWPRFAILSV